MTYDLIIIACSSNDRLIDITRRCIDSAADECDNIIIVETFPIIHEYKDCTIIQYKEAFNYNRALNQGIKYSENECLILANNDLLFYPGWSRIGPQMVANNFGSASALSQFHLQKGYEMGDYVYEGYAIEYLLTGWCIFALRSTIEKIGSLNEQFDFWYSDNVYTDQIKQAGIRHGLFCNVRVDHLTSATLKTLSYRKQRKYSFDNIRKYKAYAT